MENMGAQFLFILVWLFQFQINKESKQTQTLVDTKGGRIRTSAIGRQSQEQRESKDCGFKTRCRQDFAMQIFC